METADRIIVERLLQERRSQAAAERLARQPRPVSGPAEGRLLGSDGSAAVDRCGVPQRAGRGAARCTSASS